LWVADFDGSPYVRQLWVNGKIARRAQSEIMYDIDDFFKTTTNKYKYDGIYNKEEKFASYTNPEDIQLHFSRGWKSFLLNVESIEKADGGSRFYMYQPAFSETENDNLSHNIDVGHNFFVMNAFEELDREGEFYYNTKEKKIYYMPRAGEEIESVKAEAARLETLMQIKGVNANFRVKNLVFKNLSFAHATWYRPSFVGQVNDQAQSLHPDEFDKLVEPGYSMVPANIMLDYSEKIQFVGNKFYDLGAVGIGMYQGVVNSKVIGNSFFDIADSAITIGTDAQAYEDKVYEGFNIASGKVTSASSYDSLYPPTDALDQNGSTGWTPSGSGPHWWQVDLGEAKSFDRVEIDARLGYDQPMTRNNFAVLASNDPTFATYKTIAKWGGTPFENEGTAVLYNDNPDKFRYVRVSKTNMDYFYIADIRIIDESMEYAPGTETCKYVQVQNNYITRAGNVNTGAPGIQAYYVQCVDISNNEFYDLPYSGICTGWGWDNYADSITCRDNKINFNRVHKVMQQSFDGGAIYCLNRQRNSQIIGNYISDQPNNLSAVYLDSGSRYHTITDNVVENAPHAFYSAVISGDNLWRNNYTTPTKTFFNSSSNVLVENMVIFEPGHYPYAALEVMEKAGISEEWEYIKECAGENLFELTPEQKVNNAVRETGYGLMNDEKFVNEYLKNYLQAARDWLRIVEIGTEPGEYPKESVESYSQFISDMMAVSQKAPVDRNEIVRCYYLFQQRTKEFADSRIRYEGTTLIEKAEQTLNETEIGNKMGMVSQADYSKLETLLNEAKAKDDEISEMKLESFLTEFDSKKVNLDIYGLKLDGQLTPAEIDKDQSVVTVRVKHNMNFADAAPAITVHEHAKVSEPVGDISTGTVDYYVQTADGAQSKKWTFKMVKPDEWNSEETLDLTQIISDTENWNQFGSYNCSHYTEKVFGNAVMEFTMNIDARENDWPSFVFRAQDSEKSFMEENNASYVMVLTPGNVELHRFNDGIRTQFYGPVADCVTIFGGSVQSDAFKFGEYNDIKITTENTDEGVHIVIEINGQTVIDMVDSYDGAIYQAGYIGTVSPNAPVMLGGKQ